MAERLSNYQCPSCTAPLRYMARQNRLGCEYCVRSYSVEEIEALYAEQNQENAEDLWGDGAESMRAYSCSSCGAKLICHETTAAAVCPYCGNHGVVPAQFAGTMRPDYVIPFKLTKEDAVAALRRSCKHRLMLPKEFSRKPCLEAINGVYVPFWLFNGQADVDITFEGSNSKSQQYGREEVEITEYYDVRRAGYVDFDYVPADGSYRMPDDYMCAIEPYDYEELQPFSMAYLPGFLADRYDIHKDLAYERAKRRMEDSAEMLMQSTVSDYSSLLVKQRHVKIVRKRSIYALLPVWMLHASYEGEEYLFAVNGQTGKTVGKFPLCQKKFRACTLALAGAAAVGCAAVLTTLLSFLL